MNNSINEQSVDDEDMMNYNGGDPEEELSYLVDGSLDHALLESLFYNEMALLSSGNHTYGDESLFASSPPSGSTDSHLPPPPAVSSSLNNGCSVLEGGADFSMSPSAPINSLPLYEPSSASDATMPTGSLSESTLPMTYQPPSAPNPLSNWPAIALSVPPALHNTIPAPAVTPAYLPPSQPIAPAAAVGIPGMATGSRGGIRHNVVAVLDQDGRTQQPPNKTAVVKDVEEEKRKKLVTQFATLAGRLGITLPPQVMEKLTHKASSSNTAITNTTTTDANIALEPISLSVTPLVPSDVEGVDDTPQPPEQPELLKQLQTTAAEAIAAVNHKRSAVTANIETTSAAEKPYSKRRKKPRLSECEQKLQELQSENAILKRHLDNIANRNARLDQERVKAETQMRQLLEENAPDAVLDPIVKNFTEMYSDYGRKRHDELNFHLQQLKRLANPTNFTKMGLWTLGGGVHASSVPPNAEGTKPGGSSTNGKVGNGMKNPIAGMLQRELGISAQQGRKILEQRQKIQNVCSNLKECLILLAKLNSLCETKTGIFHNRMTKCQEVLTPRQVVKLLIWIDDNSQTLGSVCPGWGSEQFQSKTKTATTNKETIQ